MPVASLENVHRSWQRAAIRRSRFEFQLQPGAGIRLQILHNQGLFLALADRYRHVWLALVPLDGVDLGRGKRALVPGGRLHPTYQITLPRDLDEHLA